MSRQKLETDQKALEINLNDKIYGTFAEIGAGQEVARFFFQAGAAAGTIAKTMSAYDKKYSDDIYGVEPNGRYVVESRLYKMLDHEYNLLNERLKDIRPDTNFFAFADTVATINFNRTNKGDGWLGLRFQLDPNSEPNDVVIHARMLDPDYRLQQQAIGILGVNLIYGCFYHWDNLDYLLQSLIDNLKGRVMIDMIRITGPSFRHLDNRILSFKLVKYGLSDVAMFDVNGNNVHASDLLYKKHIMIVRATYKPFHKGHEDMINAGFRQFLAEDSISREQAVLLAEITLDNQKENGNIAEDDFLERADVLGAMGLPVIVSNCVQYQKLNEYLYDFKPERLGYVIRANQLLEIIIDKFEQNQEGTLLSSLGDLFTRRVRIYVYPVFQGNGTDLLHAENLPVPGMMQYLYKHLLLNKQVVNIEGANYNSDVLTIYTKEMLKLIRAGADGWDAYIPAKAADMIRKKCLFGYPCKPLNIEV